MVLYRYTYRLSSGEDRTPEIVLETYPIIDETTHSYVIKAGYKRRVYKNVKNSFAYDTKEKALKSFIAKKNMQIRILKRNLMNVTHARDIAKQIIL